MTNDDLSSMSMLDLFKLEAEGQTQTLTTSLLALERNPTAADHLESCMRAAHSLKGAARIIDLKAGVALAHAMEDCFVSVQQGHATLNQERIDLLLHGVDLIWSLATTPGAGPDQADGPVRPDIDQFIGDLTRVLAQQETEQSPTPSRANQLPAPPSEPSPPVELAASVDRDLSDRALRVSVDSINRLLGLAGDARVGSGWLKPFGESLLRLKRLQHDARKAIESVQDSVSRQASSEQALAAVADAHHRLLDCEQFLTQRLAELDVADRRATVLARRLYDETLACRMRPFADCNAGFPRMVRDVGRSLGKQVRLDIVGGGTQVDRDILELLDAPLGHLLRNAVDHGIEAPESRLQAGKPAEGTVTIEARHSAGTLQIVVSDDGRGIDLETLRDAVVKRNLATAETAGKMSENELLEFLFLPGFSMKGTVTDISGRGVGLDVVHDMLKRVRGIVRISSQLGSGTRFQLELPLTLSVVRALLVEIGGEFYAFPLAYIAHAAMVPREKIGALEGRQHFEHHGKQVGLVSGRQLLAVGEPELASDTLAVIIINDDSQTYGLVVDHFVGGRELVVHPLDPRLGKIKDISAAALTEDGSLALIVDVEDMIRSMEKLISANHLSKVQYNTAGAGDKRRKRVLVVDDSLTVRELERKVLALRGYEVDVAIDGMEGWNTLRSDRFDLVITDIDMPRMDGIELVTLIKRDVNLKSLPVMIVSYKDREEDRRRGLDAGADYYLTKGSFHDAALLNAVVDLIGEAEA
jgi:two-component system sensor histidine kinase and response regulator WspE